MALNIAFAKFRAEQQEGCVITYVSISSKLNSEGILSIEDLGMVVRDSVLLHRIRLQFIGASPSNVEVSALAVLFASF